MIRVPVGEHDAGCHAAPAGAWRPPPPREDRLYPRARDGRLGADHPAGRGRHGHCPAELQPRRPERPRADVPGGPPGRLRRRAHRRSPRGPARTEDPTSRPAPGSPGPKPEETRSPASWPASPDTTGQDATSRSCSASSPATSSPSSPNGPAWASSPRPATAGTPSPNRYPGRSQPRQARNPQRDCY